MAGKEPLIGLIIAASALVLLLLKMTKYKESRGVALAIYCLLVLSASYRVARGLAAGVKPDWVDVGAIVIFGCAAIMEGVQFFRNRSRRS